MPLERDSGKEVFGTPIILCRTQRTVVWGNLGAIISSLAKGRQGAPGIQTSPSEPFNAVPS